jgi:UDP-N-acetylmuramate dehydrogenase
MLALPLILTEQKLRPFNSFGLDATANNLLIINNIEDIKWFRSKYPTANPLLISGGSNILLGSATYPWVLLMRTRGIHLLEQSSSDAIIRVEAGENWHNLVLHCLAQGWHGLENLSLIPGNAGTAPVQNIGAYGVEIGEFIQKVEYLDLHSGKIHFIEGKNCRFGYRDSIFKQELNHKVIITAMELRLSKIFVPRLSYQALADQLLGSGLEKPVAEDVINAVCDIRRSKLPDPEVIGNAGSFFKNPLIYKEQAENLSILYADLPIWPANDLQVKIPAAWLIEKAGWKAYRKGDAGVHEKQALVLVNYGTATGEEILALAMEIQADVSAKFGVDLEREVNLVL